MWAVSIYLDMEVQNVLLDDLSCSGECKIVKYMDNSFKSIFFITNISYTYCIYLLLKYFLFCIISEQFRNRKTSCMCSSLPKEWILFVDKLLMKHLIPQWNDSDDKFVFIFNENFGISDCTKTSRQNNCSLDLYITKLIFLISAGLSVCWILPISSILPFFQIDVTHLGFYFQFH